MQDRDLIVGVLATQAGFVTPKQVMEAAAARHAAPNPVEVTASQIHN